MMELNSDGQKLTKKLVTNSLTNYFLLDHKFNYIKIS